MASVQEWEWPLNMDWRLSLVTWTIAIAGVPWLALVWLALLRLRQQPTTTAQDAVGRVDALLRAWKLLSECVFAFVTFVVIAIVTTGTVRAAWVQFAEQQLTRDEAATQFPDSYVLLYGLYFSVLMAAVTVPLVASYRRRAKEFVDARYPVPSDARISQDGVDSRSRLEGVLNLSVTIIRTPIAIFAVFTPLITSALATVVPTLGS